MSSKKSKSGQPRSVKEFRHDVAKLKAAGLVSKRVDARSQKQTRYMQGQVKKFDDVLKGRAKVVRAPRRADLAEYRDGGRYKTKGRSVVIPVESKTERVRWDAKNKRAVSTSHEYGETFTKEYMPKPPRSAADVPQERGLLYTIPLGRSYRSFDTWEDLANFMFPYATDPRKPYKDWQNFVILERPNQRFRVSRYNDADEEI